jgi:two-component system cell cycle sensor histidine kinase/response regulator CckA
MNRLPSFFHLGILKKLVLMNLLIFIVFAIVVLTVFLSFRNIENLSKAIIDKDVNQVVENAQLGRELNGVFADTNLLISTFLNKEEDFQGEAGRIVTKATVLEKKGTNPQLKESLQDFTQKLQTLFGQCTVVNNYSGKLDSLEHKLDKGLAALEGTLSEKLVAMVQEGRDVSILEQLSIIIPGYRETLLRISIQHAGLRQRHPGTSEADYGKQMLALLDDLNLRLRTLTASEPVIAAYGVQLMRNVREYKTTTLSFLQAMAELQKRLIQVNGAKEHVVTAMRVADGSISQTAGHMRGNISAVMRSSGVFILAVSGTIIVILGIFTILFSFRNIRRPMKLIRQGIESIRNGDFETKIQLDSHDEWSDIEDALNRMVEERKRAEEALRESEQRLYATIQGSPIPMFVIGKDRKVIHWNKALEQLSGTNAAGVIGTDRAWTAFYEEERPVLATLLAGGDTNAIAHCYAGKYSKSGLVDEAYEVTEFFPKWGDGGKWLHFTAATLRDTKGNLIGAMETLEDVTECKLAEEKWHSLYTNLPGGSFTVNNEYIIDDVNDVLCAVTGFAREELVGRSCGVICPKGPHKCPIFDLGKERIDNDETAVKAKDGRKVPIIKSARRIPAGNGEVIVENFQDITDRKQLEEQLRHAQKMDAIGQLAGGVAHDFNNILTAIIGYANLLKLKIGDAETFGKYVNQIISSAERAANLTHSLLAFSRKHIIELKAIKVNEIIGRAEKLLSRLIREDIELRVITGEDCVVRADSTQIEQVMMNLVTNARDAMHEGGLLTISTERIELDEGFIQTHGYGEPGTYVLISVSDTGIGMDEKTRERIFEPFFTTKETGKGTGLGLAIVYGIIKQHNGYINVYSEQGEGTTFKIYLPVIKGDTETLEISGVAIVPRGSETVLLAEDDPVVRSLTKSVLEEFGYTVVEAEDGVDAVEKFLLNADDIRLLVLDVVMPRKNGKEVHTEIIKIRPDIKVLFISGYTSDILSSRGVLEENLNFISKPVTQNVLLQKVRQVLDK